MFTVNPPCSSCQCPTCASYDICRHLFCGACKKAGLRPVNSCRGFDRQTAKITEAIEKLMKK